MHLADDDNFTVGQCLGISGLVAGVPGALIGGIVGALIRTDRWRDLDGVKVSLAPTRTGVSFGASVRF